MEEGMNRHDTDETGSGWYMKLDWLGVEELEDCILTWREASDADCTPPLSLREKTEAVLSRLRALPGKMLKKTDDTVSRG